MDLVRRAREFATEAHAAVNQVRKYTGEPYIVHPAAVASLVQRVKHTPEMLAAAWLHDTVEDTNVIHDEIRLEFGRVVGNYVWFLTDISRPTDGNRAARKLIDRRHIFDAPPEAKTVKLADIIDNTRSIVQHDPEFAKIYLVEKALLLNELWNGDEVMLRLAYDELRNGERKLWLLSQIHQES